MAMIVQPFTGILSDRTSSRWGRRRPYIFIGTLMALFLIPGIGAVNSFTTIIIVYCLLQISCNTAQASFQALIPDFLPRNRRGLASGLKSLFELLGGFALVRLTAFLMGNYYGGGGEVWLWLALGSLTLTLLTVSAFTLVAVKEKPIARAAKISFSTLVQNLRIDFKAHRDFGWFLIARGLLGIPGVLLQTFIFYYLMDVVGIANPAAAAGDLLVVVGICLVAAAYPAGRLSDRIGRRSVLLVSCVLGVIGILVLLAARSYSQILVSGALLGIANGSLLSSSWALATDCVAKDEEAKYLGVTNFAMVIGSALARLVGPVIDVFNKLKSGSGYQIMLLLCLLSFIIGALLVLKIKSKNGDVPV
jgi:Na+/melibiose symporter-like transporter